MDYKKDENSEVESYHNSWYKIPMTSNQTFERNNYYEVNIVLNRPGAIVESEPVNLQEIHYSVDEWTAVDINVSDAARPSYLQLNTDHVNIYNVNFDETTLEYASSSPISIDLIEAYYFNYLDQMVDVSSYSIYADPQDYDALNGGIYIYSQFVGKTDAEIAAELAELGEAPYVRDEPVNPEVEAPDPQAIVDKYNAQVSYPSRLISYRYTGADVEFYATGNSSTGRRNAQFAQKEYDDYMALRTQFVDRANSTQKKMEELAAQISAMSLPATPENETPADEAPEEPPIYVQPESDDSESTNSFQDQAPSA
jgi:hypothetical protein